MTEDLRRPEFGAPDRVSKKSKLITKIVVGALILAAIVVGVIFYWSVQSEDVVDVLEVPIPTRTIRDHPTAGGVVILNLDFCKKQDLKGEMRISFVSSSREAFLPLVRENSPKGCIKDLEYPVLIPKDLPADTYQVKLAPSYDINPVKQDKTEVFLSKPVIIDPVVTGNE